MVTPAVSVSVSPVGTLRLIAATKTVPRRLFGLIVSDAVSAPTVTLW